MSWPIFESGDTVQFTWAADLAPDAAPTFKVTGVAGTVIASITAVQSDTTHFYSLFTMPTSKGGYLGEWFAQRTFSGSVRNFVDKVLWAVTISDRPPI